MGWGLWGGAQKWGGVRQVTLGGGRGLWRTRPGLEVGVGWSPRACCSQREASGRYLPLIGVKRASRAL